MDVDQVIFSQSLVGTPLHQVFVKGSQPNQQKQTNASAFNKSVFKSAAKDA